MNTGSKMTACLSCHKKMHSDTVELVAGIDNEDISEHKWSDSLDGVDEIGAIDQDHNETIVN